MINIYKVVRMPRVKATATIDAPPEYVWDFVNDFDRMTEWVTFADELTYRDDGEPGEGWVYHEKGGIGPMKSESEWEITEFDPPQKQVHVGDLGIMEPTLTISLQSTNDGKTDWKQELEFVAMRRFRPLGWLLEKLVIKRSMASGLTKTTNNAKTIIEREYTGKETEGSGEQDSGDDSAVP